MHPAEADAAVPLRLAIAAELAVDVPEPMRALAAHLAQQGGELPLAVLFYGSNLRTRDLDGVIDFYLLVDSLPGWYGPRRWAALSNGALPPNVAYLEWPYQGRTLRTKFALLSLAQFQRGVAGAGIDTTLWARFAQPAALVWARDAAAQQAAEQAVAQAVTTAARWAALLGPEQASASAYWDSLFARTYAAELRVETKQRASSIVAHAEARFAALLPLAWQAAGIACEVRRDELRPQLSVAERSAAERAWAWRAGLGKPLNLLRLVKGAWTFDGGADYLAWKVERHSGLRVELSDWQRRHPVLSAPRILWQLRRKGVIR
ncbi:MAG: hypothetical protein Q8Q73_15315 [Stagnimonas sp.]|nr:hypothetical protein [Stagnimonas sp.]